MSLTPYDTGKRLTPVVWPTKGIESRFGKVDFDDEESATVLTAYVERGDDGSYVLHVRTLSDSTPLRVAVDEDVAE